MEWLEIQEKLLFCKKKWLDNKLAAYLCWWWLHAGRCQTQGFGVKVITDHKKDLERGKDAHLGFLIGFYTYTC